MKFRHAISAFVLIISLSIFGFGCDKPAPEETGTGQNRNSATVTQAEYQKLRRVQEDAPKGLAYVVLDKGASATVSRGQKSTDVKDGMALYAGDALLVGTGTVKLIYPESGASRLESGTAIIILPDGEVEPGQGVGALIILKAGEIWTRFERLLDLGEAFSVESSGVVATVRGTAFGVQNKQSKVNIKVTDHAVRIATVRDWRRLKEEPDDFMDMGVELAAGQKMEFDEVHLLAFSDEPVYYYEDTGKPMAAPPPDPDYLMLQSISKMTPEEMEESEEIFADDFGLDEFSEPQDPWLWEEPPKIAPEMEKYLDPEAVKAWEELERWIMDHEQEILEAERIRAEMEAAGMFTSPDAMPGFEELPADYPELEGAEGYPPEPIGYDEFGNPIYPVGDMPRPPPDEYNEPVYEEPVPEEPLMDESVYLEPDYDGIELLGIPAE